MLPILHLGPLAIPAPAMILLLGLWLGLDLTEKQSVRYGAAPAKLYNLVLVMLIAGFVGARLVYAARIPGTFLSNPLNLVALSPQMFDVPGGLVIAVLAGAVYLALRRMPLWPTLDALVTLLSALAITLGLANFASGDAFGAPAHLPWSIQLWGELRHPAQVYETLAALMVAIMVWPDGRFSAPSEIQTPNHRPGFRFWTFLALSATARLFLETFRGDSTLVAGFRLAQVIAWGVLAISLWQIGRRIKATDELPVEAETEENG